MSIIDSENTTPSYPSKECLSPFANRPIVPAKNSNVGVFRAPDGVNKLLACKQYIKNFTKGGSGLLIQIESIELEEVEDLRQSLSREGQKFR